MNSLQLIQRSTQNSLEKKLKKKCLKIDRCFKVKVYFTEGINFQRTISCILNLLVLAIMFEDNNKIHSDSNRISVKVSTKWTISIMQMTRMQMTRMKLDGIDGPAILNKAIQTL